MHNWSLAAAVRRSGLTKAEVARRAEMTPAQLGDLLSGRRAGRSAEVRARIAEALGEDVRALTCWCADRQGNHDGGAA